MTDRTREQKWARGMASNFDGLPLDAVLVGIREGMFSVDWARAVQAAKLYQLDVEQAESERRQAAHKRKVSAALDAATAETDPFKRAGLMLRYFRAADREAAEWKTQEQIWKRREQVWAK